MKLLFRILRYLYKHISSLFFVQKSNAKFLKFILPHSQSYVLFFIYYIISFFIYYFILFIILYRIINILISISKPSKNSAIVRLFKSSSTVYCFIYQKHNHVFKKHRDENEWARAPFIDIIIARGVVSFFGKTLFEKPEDWLLVVDRVTSKIGFNPTCGTWLVHLLSLRRVREKSCWNEGKKGFY